MAMVIHIFSTHGDGYPHFLATNQQAVAVHGRLRRIKWKTFFAKGH